MPWLISAVVSVIDTAAVSLIYIFVLVLVYPLFLLLPFSFFIFLVVWCSPLFNSYTSILSAIHIVFLVLV